MYNSMILFFPGKTLSLSLSSLCLSIVCGKDVNYTISYVEVNFYVLFQYIFYSLNLSENLCVTLIHWEPSRRQCLHSAGECQHPPALPCLNTKLSSSVYIFTSPCLGLNTPHSTHAAVFLVCRPLGWGALLGSTKHPRHLRWGRELYSV